MCVICYWVPYVNYWKAIQRNYTNTIYYIIMGDLKAVRIIGVFFPLCLSNVLKRWWLTFIVVFIESLSHVLLCDPIDCSLPDSTVHGVSQNTGVGCHFLLQEIFPTQVLNQHLLQVSHIAGEFFTPELSIYYKLINWCIFSGAFTLLIWLTSKTKQTQHNMLNFGHKQSNHKERPEAVSYSLWPLCEIYLSLWLDSL